MSISSEITRISREVGDQTDLIAQIAAALAGKRGGSTEIVPLTATENGVYQAETGQAYSPVTVAVPQPEPVIEPLSVTANGTYTAPSGVDGYDPVTVAVPQPSGTKQITQAGETDVTEFAKANVPNASLALNTPSVNSSGLVTASATLTSAGWQGAAPSNKTLQLTTQAGKTVTPTESEQTAVASGRYTTGDVKVAAIQTEEKTVTQNGEVTPTTGKYLKKVTVNVSGGGGKNIQYSTTVAKVTNKTSYTSVGGAITVAKTGNYKCTWVHYAYAAGSTSTYATQLYAGGSAKGSAHSCPAYNGSSGWSVTENSISLTAGQTVEVRARTRSGSSYWTVAGLLVIEEL